VNTTVDRILTTHTGSLPRPDDLVPMLYARERGKPVDEATMAGRIREAVADGVQEQLRAGLDVVNDGEASKVMYAVYAQDRLAGFGGQANLDERSRVPLDIADFPRLAETWTFGRSEDGPRFAACDGPIGYRGQEALAADLARLRSALDGAAPEHGAPADAFVSAASPGVVSLFLPNRHYPRHDAYVWAIAEAMKVEYDAIHRAGFVLQLDCPDLAMGRHHRFGADLTPEEFLRVIALHVDAINHATRDIPPERMRMHVCWGNYEGPHHRDVPLGEIVDVVLRARPAGLSVEGANPRHAHEWRVWEETPLPAGKYLIPGVIDSTTNYIEHPMLVAERIVRFARVVGRERVIAGVDCGLATVAGHGPVDPEVAWAKLRSLTEGAALATLELW
jgi:5-methyltetrahydropteroyltriglutamate--homocysteine methyltransferase